MIALYFLILFGAYHGAVLWLALRFKGKPWHWYWFVGVLAVGIGYAWWDRLFIYAVVEEDWCKRPEVGFHELAPVKIKAADVTWLGFATTRWPNGNIKSIELDDVSKKLVHQETFFKDEDNRVTTTNYLSCGNLSGSDNSGACIASGYRIQTEQKEYRFLGRYLVTRERNLLLHGDMVLRDSVSYHWGSNWFLKGTGFTPGTVDECGQGPVLWSNETKTKTSSVTIVQ